MRLNWDSFCFPIRLARDSSLVRLELPMVASRKPFHKREVEIIKRLRGVIKVPVTKIALAVGRHKRTAYRCLQKEWEQLPRGRPQMLRANEVSKLMKVMRLLAKKANGEKEVTLAMIKRSARCKFSGSTIQRRLQARSVKFRKLHIFSLFHASSAGHSRATRFLHGKRACGLLIYNNTSS